MKQDIAIRHCLASLREADRDRYTATLYLPQPARDAASAIYAFNAEISAIADRVSEPVPGEIRLQWWRDVVEGKRESGDNPVAMALLETLRRFSLPQKPIVDLLEARQFDLYNDPMPDRQALEAWCGETSSVLLQMVALAAGAAADKRLAEACGHAGVAIAIVRILQQLQNDRRKARIYLPADMLAATGLSLAEWLAGPVDARHGVAVEALLALAREHHVKALAAIHQLGGDLAPVFLPLAPVPAWCAAAQLAGNAMFERPPSLSPLRRQIIIGMAALRGMA